MDSKKIENAVRDILEAIGEDPQREGLKETPTRVARMYEEVFSGLSEDPRDHLKIFHESGNDEQVVVRDIPLYSMCEHHLLPFIGKAHIAYIPSDGRIIGLSKLARIVNTYARRPQVQERLTAQIADFLYNELQAKSVVVVVEAEHLCMTMRGARAAGALTKTSALRGYARNDAKTRAEAMSLIFGELSLFAKVIILEMAMPVAACTTIYSEQYDGDVGFATKGVLLTTVISLITLSLFAVLIEL